MCEASHSSATSGMVSPHAPLNVAVSAREDMAVVSWEGQSDATYVVEVSQDEAFTKATQTKADTTTAAIADLVPATHYYARVRSAAPLGQLSAFSEVVTFTTAEPGYILAPPVVKLSMDGFSTLKATWKQAAVDKPTYEVSFEPAADADATAQPSASADASAEPSASASAEPSSSAEASAKAAATDADKASTETTTKRKATFDGLAEATAYTVKVRALDDDGTPLSDWSEPETITTPEDKALRVGSYNVLCASACTSGKGIAWSKRRAAVLSTIKDQAPDVLGMQEAMQATIPGGSVAQFQDIVNGLDGQYAVTDNKRGTTRGTRIIYNTETVTLQSSGWAKLPKSSSTRFMTWGFFTQKATGKKFLFVDTHLEHMNDKSGSTKYWAVRKRQTQYIVAKIKALNTDNLPVIVVGDLNSTSHDKPSNVPAVTLAAAGYDNALTGSTDAASEKRINTSYSSYNDYKSSPHKGSNTDYIFVSPMRVSEFETVVKLDSDGTFSGVVPSDHNMVRADVWLPND